MKKNYLKLMTLAFFLSIVIYSCREEFEQIVFSDEDTEILEAQSWYEQNKPPGAGLKSAAQHGEKIYVRPDWKHAFARKHEKNKTVEIPLSTQGRFGFAPVQNKKAYDETGDFRYMHSLTRLVIQTEKQSKNTIGFFMTIVPDKDFLEEKQFRAYYSSYKKLQKGFTGYVLYHTLEGDFANGWKFYNGEVTHSVEEDGTGIDVQLKSGQEEEYNCTAYFMETWTQHCTEYYTITEYVIVNVIDEICDAPVVVKELVYVECTKSDGTPIGGDGDYTPPSGQEPATPSVDALSNDNSTLDPSENQLLEQALINFKEKYPIYGELYNTLLSKEIKFSFKINSSCPANAAFYTNGIIEFKNKEAIKEINLTEELIHAIQYYTHYGSNMTDLVRNFEFEAKVFQDYACLSTSGSTCPMIATFGQTSDFAIQYRDWLINVCDDQGGFTFEDKEIFNNFCNAWTGYPGTVSTTFTPETLNEYFEGIP
uniref:hypothetical protein n=1 Tax=uncultured Draconibacterium sp. TaxID=1573823 RepID=UPI003217F33B